MNREGSTLDPRKFEEVEFHNRLRDNVVSGLFPGLPELGVRPTALEAIIPSYLDRFRRGGWYASLK